MLFITNTVIISSWSLFVALRCFFKQTRCTECFLLHWLFSFPQISQILSVLGKNYTFVIPSRNTNHIVSLQVRHLEQWFCTVKRSIQLKIRTICIHGFKRIISLLIEVNNKSLTIKKYYFNQSIAILHNYSKYKNYITF